MNIPSRSELEQRLRALTQDALERTAENEPDGFDIGVVLIVYEVRFPRPGSPYLKRSDAGYTPDDDIGTYFSYWCSDHRTWIQKAVTEEAYELARQLAEDDEGEETDDEDGETGQDEGYGRE